MTTVVPGPVTADPGSAADRAAAERMLATVYRLVDPTRMQLVEMLARRRERIGCHHGRWRDVLLLERRGRHVAST